MEAGLALRDTFFPTSGPAHMWAALREGNRYYLLCKRDTTGWALGVHYLVAAPGLEHDLFDSGGSEHGGVTNRLANSRAQLSEGDVRVLRSARDGESRGRSSTGTD